LSKKATAEQKLHYAAVKDKVVAATHINASIVAKQQIKKVSSALKKSSSGKSLTHVIDRGADDSDLFTFIDKELQDKFVIRLKSSRVAEQPNPEAAKEKLVDKAFTASSIMPRFKLKARSIRMPVALWSPVRH